MAQALFGGRGSGTVVGHPHVDRGPTTRSGINTEMAADHLDPFAHAGQAEVALAEQAAGRVVERLLGDPVQDGLQVGGEAALQAGRDGAAR
jgi:hypothetical protein